MAMAICVLYGPARTSSCALPGAGAAVPADTVALTILYPGAARGAQNFAILGGNFSRSRSKPNKILSKFYANLSKSKPNLVRVVLMSTVSNSEYYGSYVLISMSTCPAMYS